LVYPKKIHYLWKMKTTLLILLLFPKIVGNNEFKVDFRLKETTKNNKELVNKTELVTLTTYSPTMGETDSSPNITASGFKIDVDDPSKHKIIAVSRDLKRKWKFNQKVRIRKAGKYNGIYTVKDVMNKRHRKRIDILVNSDEKPTKLRNVQVTLIK
jgi:3D (Asp-Asp-Asp) domain-containing protein